MDVVLGAEFVLDRLFEQSQLPLERGLRAGGATPFRSCSAA